jgi:hypothetical protein
MGEWYCSNQILFVGPMYSLKCTYNFDFYVDKCLTQSRETTIRANNIGMMCSKSTTSLLQRID